MALQQAELKNETELEFLLKQDLEQIENGLKAITNQLKTSTGRIDILAIDSDKNLVIIELKQFSDENQMSQAVAYFDWILKNIDWIKDAYKIEAKDSAPRIILVAKEFPEKVVILAKYWNEYISQVSLYSYKSIVNNGKKEVISLEVSLPRVPEITEKPKQIEDIIGYITNENVKEVAKKLIDKVQTLDENIEFVPRNDRRVAFKYKQRNFGALTPRKESFAIEYRSQSDNESKWPSETSIDNFERADLVIENKLKPALEFIKQK